MINWRRLWEVQVEMASGRQVSICNSGTVVPTYSSVMGKVWLQSQSKTGDTDEHKSTLIIKLLQLGMNIRVCVYVCVYTHVREWQQAGSAGLSRAGRAAVTEARGLSQPKSGVLGVEPSEVWAGVPAGVLPRSMGAALCAPRACAVCSCFTAEGSGIHIRGTSNPWPRLVPSSWVGGEGSEWHRTPWAAAQRGERSSSAAWPGCSGPSSSLYGGPVGLPTHVAPRLSWRSGSWVPSCQGRRATLREDVS